MNRKSIFGIFLILVALSLTLGAVSAEEVIIDDGSAKEMLSVDESVAAEDVLNSESDESLQTLASAGDGSNVAVANLTVDILAISDEEDESSIVWSILVHNYGSDISYNTRVTVDGTSNLNFENPFNKPTILFTDSGLHVSYYDSKGIFDYHKLTWLIGDLEPYSYTELLIRSVKQGLGQCSIEVLLTSDSVDYDLSDNYAFESVGQPTNSSQSLSVNESLPHADSPSSTQLPSAGNPFVVALLALMIIGAGGIKRKF